MDTSTPRRFLDGLLRGERAAADDIRQMIALHSQEGLHHDFKSGSVAREALNGIVRRWTMGFANSDGGVLILGVTEPKTGAREIDGFRSPGNGDPVLWAGNVLNPYAGRFSPPPQIQSVPMGVEGDDRQVLLVAAERAPQLIAHVEGGTPKYALRIGSSTVDADPYLVSDLLLGRRNRPVLDLLPVEFLRTPADAQLTHLVLKARFRVTNLSFVKAEDVEIAAVSYSIGRPTAQARGKILEFIEPEQFVTRYDPPTEARFIVLHSPANRSVSEVRPFGELPAEGHIAYLPRNPGQGYLRFGVYVICAGSMPLWYQLEVMYQVQGDALVVADQRQEVKIGERVRLWWEPKGGFIQP